MTLHRNIKLLAFHNFCSDFVLFAPVAIIYFARVTGSYTLGMSIFSIAYGSSALLELPTGILSDFIGRKRTMILGSLCSVLAIIFYAVGLSYWILVIGAVFQGASRAFFSGNNDALLHDSLKHSHQENEYHVFLGKTNSMFQIALAASSVLGGIMASISFPLVMWASVIPQIFGLLLSLYIIETTSSSHDETNIYAHTKEACIQFVKNAKLRSISISSVIRFSLGESGYFFRSAFVAMLWPVWAIGISNFISNIGGAVSFYFSGKLIKKYTPVTLLSAETISSRMINFVALLFPTVFSPALMGLTSLTFGVGYVATNSLLQKEFTEKQRATMGSLNSLAGSIGFAIISVLLGAFADNFGPVKTLILVNILLFTPLIFYWKISKNT